MKKSLFVRIQYDTDNIAVEDIRINLHESLSNCPIKITTTFYESMAEDHADYIEYVINK